MSDDKEKETYTTKQPWSEKTTLYEDEDIKITKQEMVIKRYYMPLAIAKHIALGDIESFEVLEGTPKDHKLWGISFNSLRDMMFTWWPYNDRSWSKGYHMKLKIRNQKYMYPAFTCSNLTRVEDILKEETSQE